MIATGSPEHDAPTRLEQAGYVDMATAREMTGYSIRTLHRLVKNGDVESCRDRGKRWILRTSLESRLRDVLDQTPQT
ncbi:MAG TPA: hypothetical protein VGL93_10335 [Streptosporangiaceae bacterium]